MSRWVKHSFGIETRSHGTDKFDNKAKMNSEQKKRYNTINCAMYVNTKHFWECIDEHGPCHILCLEGVYCGTSTRLIEDCHADPEMIDIVSKHVEFRPTGRASQPRPQTYTGELLTFLKKQPTDDKSLYDVVVLDFCGAWSDNMEACITELFKRKLMRDLSAMSITFCERPAPTDFRKQTTFKNVHRMREIANVYGYEFGYTREFCSGPAMQSVFVKIIRPEDALDKTHPLKNNLWVSEWFRQPVLLEDENPFVYQSALKKRKKRNSSKQ